MQPSKWFWGAFISLFLFANISFCANITLGIETLQEDTGYVEILKNKRLGLITNQTGVDSNLKSTIDILQENPNFNLTALFAPEHGIGGDLLANENVAHSMDEKTKLPVYSLYGKTRQPTEEMLEKVDVLIFDIQDIGARTYTYISTLFLAMEAADKYGKEFLVLDRPNPLGGLNVEGPVMKDEYKSFIGLLPIPMVHGMTVGELAKFVNGEYNMSIKLSVVPMKNWKRNMIWDDTGLTWIPTSPHIPTVDAAFFYAATGTISSANLSNGVGYTLPFQLIGGEWIDPYKLADALNSKNLPGVKFQPYWFKPFYSTFKDKELKGVRLVLTDKKVFQPVKTSLEILISLQSLYPDVCKPPRDLTQIWGVDYIFTNVKEGKTADEIIKSWQEDLTKFKEKREKYLLYK
ncbi:MAG: DUF1343 domain-containing protein [Candidatus Ratteibacteria bacterium]|nr:DUF1343 domain-containing protein [Candidatus Ratteibacteria bacterium]